MIRKIVFVVFNLLALAFLFRFAQNGYKWVSHASSPDVNYKAMTIWCAIYLLVCAAIAWVTVKLPKEETDTEEAS